MTEGTTNSGHISFLFQILLIFGPKKSGFPTHLLQVSRRTQRLKMLNICLFLCGPNFSRGNSIFYFFLKFCKYCHQETSYPALNPTKNQYITALYFFGPWMLEIQYRVATPYMRLFFYTGLWRLYLTKMSAFFCKKQLSRV